MTNREESTNWMDAEVCANQVLAQLRAIALTDVTDVVCVADGTLAVRSTAELTEGQRSAIASIEKSTGGLKVKFYDKLKALELLGKCVGVFDRPPASASESSLLRAIDKSTGREIDAHDLQELQQASAAGDDLVEPTPVSGL